MTTEYPQPSSPTADPAERTNVLAIVSLVASIIGAHLVGIVTGHIALSALKKAPQRGRGLALAGVIIGYVGFVLVLVIFIVGILAAISIPVFRGQQDAARDSAVMSDLTTLKVAIISQMVSDPSVPMSLDPMSYADFTPSEDSSITIVGDYYGFCLSGSSIAGGEGATTFAISDTSSAIEGTCVGVIATPAGS
jgi:type II secretory pathway pseudopilin PulG